MSSIQKNVSLSDFSSYKIGGQARYFAQVSSVEDLKKILQDWNEISKDFTSDEKSVFILGGGTNVLFSDEGFDGLVIHDNIGGIEILEKDKKIYVKVGAGVLIEDLLKFCIEENLAGFEWAGGLPGTLGGAIRGNAGAFGGETKDLVYKVKSLNIQTLEVVERNSNECTFGYRQSIFKNEGMNEVVVEAVIVLQYGKKSEIEAKTNEKIEYRRQRHPNLSIEPNAGSTFKNIPIKDVPESVIQEFKNKIKNDPFPILPVVKLIAGAGLAGTRVGSIEVSSIHPNYLVNIGNGKARDVLDLISKIKKEVFDKYGVEIEEELTVVN